MRSCSRSNARGTAPPPRYLKSGAVLTLRSATLSRSPVANRLPSPGLLRKTTSSNRSGHFRAGIFATCAGMVLMATHVDDPRIRPLGLMEMTVDRNAFGRQKESFEADIPIDGLDGGPFHAVFIRAPLVTSTGTGVTVTSRIPQGVVAVECGRYLAFAFHPELGGDTRLHERFLTGLGI